MTAPDPVVAFLAALDPTPRQRINRTERLVVLIHKAIRNGWTIPQLVEATAGTTHAGVVMHRLERCADRKPPAPTLGRVRHRGCCEDGWIYDETGDTGRATKCPGQREANA